MSELEKTENLKLNPSLKFPLKIKRTHYCGDLRASHVNQRVTVMGWIDSQRDHGGRLFIGLRDRSGLAQVVFDEHWEGFKEKKCDFSIEDLKGLKNESVVSFWGLVRLRPEGKKNVKIKTGGIEIQCEGFHIFSKAKNLPFQVSTKSFGLFTESDSKQKKLKVDQKKESEFKKESKGGEKGKGKEREEDAAGVEKHFEVKVSESLRLKYRYLDLRSLKLQKFLFLRHRALQCIRQFFSKEGFWEIETPILYKSTPEGAKDYLVPSRIYPGQFYALPQSPQILKQLLMISGVDRYFQMAKCFRDEDLRENRQPEFTQIDMEMSFVFNEEDVMEVNERLLGTLWKVILNEQIDFPLPRLSYREALSRYGTDAPDLRVPWEFRDISSLSQSMECEIFKKAVRDKGEKVIGLKLPKIRSLSKTFLKKLADRAKEFKANGLIWIFKNEGKWTSPIEKILSQDDLKKLFFAVPLNRAKNSVLNSTKGEGFKKEDEVCTDKEAQREKVHEEGILFLVADQERIAFNFLLFIRAHFAKELKILDKKKFSFLWVTDFPLLEFDSEEKKWKSCHHPFTAPKEDDVSILLNKNASEYSRIRSRGYDLVCNGSEIAGGSLRNYSPKVQQSIFHALNLEEKEIKEKFGFFIEALDYGVPPHGGIAWGFDRLVALMCGTSVLRDVIAFPKTRKAVDLVSGSPSGVPRTHLKELGIKKD